jgi:hypothetical protein
VYNKQIEEFYAEYERYLIQLSEFQDRKGTTVTLQIALSNTGSSPARDIHIFLRFPEGVEVHDEDSFEDALVEPREPKAPLERPGPGSNSWSPRRFCRGLLEPRCLRFTPSSRM